MLKGWILQGKILRGRIVEESILGPNSSLWTCRVPLVLPGISTTHMSSYEFRCRAVGDEVLGNAEHQAESRMLSFLDVA